MCDSGVPCQLALWIEDQTDDKATSCVQDRGRFGSRGGAHVPRDPAGFSGSFQPADGHRDLPHLLLSCAGDHRLRLSGRLAPVPTSYTTTNTIVSVPIPAVYEARTVVASPVAPAVVASPVVPTMYVAPIVVRSRVIAL